MLNPANHGEKEACSAHEKRENRVTAELKLVNRPVSDTMTHGKETGKHISRQ